MKVAVSIILSFVLFMPVQNSFAVAFCSLRDPLLHIKELYPSYSNFYASVVDVNIIEATMSLNQYKLPFFLHPKEVGKHTVYFIEDESGRIGIVHPRSEFGKWGVIEIVWSLSLEGEILDYRFQRCRDPACKDALSGPVKELFKGISLGNLSRLFNVEGNIAAATAEGLNQDMFETMVKSATKTLILTNSFLGQANP
ncbi:MAG: hypothetical protein HOL98_05355 [Gammaproteobacteria bacterium]|jgi:hypothetical protein|nr:hypothetical protein [Gammaproteobacteria bacterium]MBT5202866.1 hypothetical protein [Gammaproteobacteria bacterium]MBT5603844.1 hypothetical protein [Gammaproteobacteria bacterium]MBT6246529.1 hypothetical protein [Gammaproteobacteria bacterium]